MSIMKKRILSVAASVVIGALYIGTVDAQGVSNWSELKTYKDEASIEFQNDITADGATPPTSFPSPITFTNYFFIFFIKIFHITVIKF